MLKIKESSNQVRAYTSSEVQYKIVQGWMDRAEYAVDRVKEGSASEQSALEVMLHSCMVMLDGNAGDLCAIGVTSPNNWREVQDLLVDIDPEAQIIKKNWIKVFNDVQSERNEDSDENGEPVGLSEQEFLDVLNIYPYVEIINILNSNVEESHVDKNPWSGALALGLELAYFEAKKSMNVDEGIRKGSGFLVNYLIHLCEGKLGPSPVVMYSIGHEDDVLYHKERQENWFLPLNKSINPLTKFDIGGTLGRSITLWGIDCSLNKKANQILQSLKEAVDIKKSIKWKESAFIQKGKCKKIL